MAQGTPTVSQLDQERQHIELKRKQTFDPNDPAPKAKKNAMPNSADIDREACRVDREHKQMFDPGNPMTKSAVNVFPNVPTSGRAETDIETLTKQYEQKAQTCKVDDLMTFVSSTMPTESLKRIVSQTNRVGASVVLCSFKNSSLKGMALAIKELGEQGDNVLVNPNTSTKYKVKAVPAMVLAKVATIDQVDDEDCALPNNFVAAAGNASLGYTLDEIMRRAPQFKTVAPRYLRQIRGSQ